MKRKPCSIYDGFLVTFGRLRKQQQPTLPGLVSWSQHGSEVGMVLQDWLCSWARCSASAEQSQALSTADRTRHCRLALLLFCQHLSPMDFSNFPPVLHRKRPICCSLVTRLSLAALATGLWSRWFPLADHHWYFFHTYWTACKHCCMPFSFSRASNMEQFREVWGQLFPEVKNEIHKAGYKLCLLERASDPSILGWQEECKWNERMWEFHKTIRLFSWRMLTSPLRVPGLLSKKLPRLL